MFKDFQRMYDVPKDDKNIVREKNMYALRNMYFTRASMNLNLKLEKEAKSHFSLSSTHTGKAISDFKH